MLNAFHFPGMLPQVSNGEMIVPVYMAACGAPLVLLLYGLAVYSVLLESGDDRVCHFTPVAWVQFDAPPNSSHVTDHPGCSAGPYYTSRDECEDCFPPLLLNNFSDAVFTPLPERLNLFPRGPASIVKPHREKQQTLVTSVLMVPYRVCVRSCPYLVAMLLSTPADWEARVQIRQTWASVARTNLWPGQGELKAQVGVIFVLGASDYHRKEEMRFVEEEQNLFGDILFLNMVDIYSNIALKIVSALQWLQQHCSSSKFFMKIDLDTFPNVALLVDVLVYHEQRLRLSVTGHIYTRNRVVGRKGRWAVGLLEYPMNQFPVYAAGCAYVMSREAVKRLVWLFPHFPRLVIEDVFLTGLLAREARLNHFSPAHRHYFAEYYTTHIGQWCKFLRNELITMTSVDTTNRRLTLWTDLISNQGQCQEKRSSHLTATCWHEFPMM